MQLFLKEVTVWTGLNQRNILPLLAFVEDPPLMISELVTDGNLRRRMEKLDWDLAAGARFLRDVADGMAYLHSFRVLHGDLKSLNVLVDRDTAKITDFGLAKFREEVSRTSGTAAGGLRGTIGFMAPELFEERPLAPPADVYAFAMLSFEVYSKGGWPFEGSNPHAIIRKVCDKRERPKRPEGVPDRAWELVEACWRQEPGERPAFPQVCAVMESWGGPP
ncbi:kinase-like domain-containing protein [Hyaloraphidium curvatum]|nr:kinase-like domain-containing protein [Hyaloraphidium curvatum]